MRAGPQLGQTSITFEMWIGDFLLGDAALDVPLRLWLETVFFTTRTCSTSTVPLSGNTRSTRPCLAAVGARETLTVSLR